mgnify:CR=1 FL=1
MPPPLIATKLDLPRLPALHLERPRLDALWAACQGRRLLLVTAGAGFGKTAFLARAAGRHEGPVAWLSLDEEDGEPAAFALHVHEALRRACGGAAALCCGCCCAGTECGFGRIAADEPAVRKQSGRGRVARFAAAGRRPAD